jgi:hypothetical protein
MSVQTRSNLPQHEPLRWNLKKAATEFGTTVDTLTKSLNQVSASPDSDGCYSTKQLIQARFGALYQEKLRTQREMGDRIALENQITRSEVFNKSELSKGFAALADAMTHIIKSSKLSREEQEDLQRELAGVPIVISNVARRQSKLHRAKNGQAKEDEGEG